MELKIINNLKKYINYEGGFFVEAGANDGIFQSNTLFYERELGWKGLLIEPNFCNYLNCLKNRPNSINLNCALVSDEYCKKKQQIYLDQISSPMAKVYNQNFVNNFLNFKKKLYVNATSLNKIFSIFDLQQADLLSLDVEGFEMDVLKGINFEKIKIKYICIEVWDSKKELIFNFLRLNNYEMIADLSEFNLKDYPHWSGDHNDYLFKKI